LEGAPNDVRDLRSTLNPRRQFVSALLLAVCVAVSGRSALASPDSSNAPEEEAAPSAKAPAKMCLIPAGPFTMGDSLDHDDASLPLHKPSVSAFYMDKHGVTKAEWDKVYNWALQHGYSFDNAGAAARGGDHPVQMVSWFDSVKWCNARSEKEGKSPAYYTDAAHTKVFRTGTNTLSSACVNWNAGYRLPTEAEWEKAARGGLEGKRFPWGDTIHPQRANYFADPASNPYDMSDRKGTYRGTTPAGYFPPNGYGLQDVAGNVWEWCWDWRGPYSEAGQTDPRGPESGTGRILRGGSWDNAANNCRVAVRSSNNPIGRSVRIGFRCVLPGSQASGS
jgi:formylglycine-generating enzyme required for sulfatase activity